MSNSFYKVYSGDQIITAVPADDMFECLFWLFSLYSKEIASDEVVESCEYVAECVKRDIFPHEYQTHCNFLALDLVRLDADKQTLLELWDGSSALWGAYREDMRQWYRFANGELVSA